MPTPAYMSITGETQGDITKDAYSADSVGNSWQEAHVDEFLVQELDHVLTIPRDPQSGQPTGQRVHKPAVHRFYSTLWYLVRSYLSVTSSSTVLLSKVSKSITTQSS